MSIQQILLALGGSGGGGEVAQTWDPANKGNDVALSGGNFIATISNYPDLALSTGSKSSGKWYFEILIGSQTHASWGLCGLAGASSSPTSAPSGGALARSSGGWLNGSGGSNPASHTTGDVVGFAMDFSTGILLPYKNNTQSGSRNVSAGALKICAFQEWGGGAPGYVFTIRTTTAEFSYSPPSGFLPWGA